MTRSQVVGWILVTGLVLPRMSAAGQNPVPAGPPPPVPPAVMVRDGSGRVSIRAVRLTTPLRIDGKLDEQFYTTVPSLSGFIQTEPQEGQPATEKTEMWLAFDNDTIYVSARCWESRPERLVANEMRRDMNSVYTSSDNVGFMFDSFYDRRNAVLFIIDPIGGRNDAQVTNQTQINMDWNPIWSYKVGRFEGGWTVEAAIPFKSLRYGPGRAQVWGFNAVRSNRWKNELSYLNPVPRARGMSGIMWSSLGATVVGLEVPSGSRNLDIKPYAIADLSSDTTTTPKISNDLGKNAGLDVKYGVTQNLTADFTYRTDFAQVEADEQQVNLTRFSLFFPEKRDFFLENAGIFQFAGATGANSTPVVFNSRQIGLNQGHAVPLEVGGRLTGRIGQFSIGALNLQADREPITGAPPTNFSVARLKADVLRRSSIGVLFTGRSVAQGGVGANEAYGVDGTFAFFQNLAINTYWAKTRTGGLQGPDNSYRAQLDYEADRYGVQLEHLFVGKAFNPEVGFVQRPDMRQSDGLFRFSPRPRNSARIRKLYTTGAMSYIQNGAGHLETRIGSGEFDLELQNSDKWVVVYTNDHEFLPRPFPIAPAVTLPIGAYDFSSIKTGYNFGQQRRLFGNASLEYGTFYSGHKTTIALGTARWGITPQLSAEPTVSLNWINLAEGAFTDRLVGSRVTFTATPLLFVSALVQYNSNLNSLATNARLRWEYRPGSELFVVYNDQRNTLVSGIPALTNRAIIVKINRLFRF